MRTLLRIVGVIELIGYVIGILFWIKNVPFEWPFILYFIIYLVYAPAFGLLCVIVPNLQDSRDALQTKVDELTNRLDSLEMELKYRIPVDEATTKSKLESKPTKKDAKELFSVGDIVVLLEDYTTSDDVFISKGAVGEVKEVTAVAYKVLFNIKGKEITVYLGNDKLGLKKLNSK